MEAKKEEKMKKIKTEEGVLVWLGDHIDWCSEIQGFFYTKFGVIELVYASSFCRAIIVYRGKLYRLGTEQKVTRLGWARIAKRWADKIWKPRKEN